MNRSISDTARILGVERDQVKNWAFQFSEFLSEAANPAKGQPRHFTDSDFLVLAYISKHWEAAGELEAFKGGLEEQDHLDEEFRELLYLHAPILQEPPDGLDETWQHGVLWTGGHGQQRFDSEVLPIV